MSVGSCVMMAAVVLTGVPRQKDQHFMTLVARYEVDHGSIRTVKQISAKPIYEHFIWMVHGRATFVRIDPLLLSGWV